MSESKNLSLQEAIVIALINHPLRIAPADEIINYIKKRSFFRGTKKSVSLDVKIMKYLNEIEYTNSEIIEHIGKNYFRLKNTPDPLSFWNDLESIFKHHQSLFKPAPYPKKMFDTKLFRSRVVTVYANNIICTLTKEKSGEKKYVYILEPDLKGGDSIGVYTLNDSLTNILNFFDPLQHYLTIINDSTIVNVAHFNIGSKKTVVPMLHFPDITALPQIKFSTSPAAKTYFALFEKKQERYIKHISLEKTILQWQNVCRKVL